MIGMPKEEAYDVAVIGAGPAGLAAATLAACYGLATVLLDEQPTPGGQVYRAVTKTPVQERTVLGSDYWRGSDLADAFHISGAEYAPGTAVWNITPDREIGISNSAGARLISARHIILATGALERPFPIPGWTLPGVMTCGAMQILMKTSGLVPDCRIVLAGTGPLLWLLAAQLLRAKVKIETVLDTTPRRNWRAALPHLPAFLLSSYAPKGLALMREVKRQVRVISGVTALAADGDGRLEMIRYRRGGGSETAIPTDLLMLHQGVTPNVNLANAIGCEHNWNPVQHCFVPATDQWGMSTVPGISIAGDGAGIRGAVAAEHRGRLAALEAARLLGRIDQVARDRAAVPYRAALNRADRGRHFIDLLYRPSAALRVPTGETIVCRCEEVTARQVEEVIARGCPGPNQLKALLRCGMGPCQGRLCGLTVTEMIAKARAQSPAEIGHYRQRPPVKPITVAELATLPQTEAAQKAVAGD